MATTLSNTSSSRKILRSRIPGGTTVRGTATATGEKWKGIWKRGTVLPDKGFPAGGFLLQEAYVDYLWQEVV